jgi:predicted RNase H-like HicB family nuclease
MGTGVNGYRHNSLALLDRRYAMDEPLTAVFEKCPHGYIGYVEELPSANTQGNTLEEAKANLIEAVQLYCRQTGNWRESNSP